MPAADGQVRARPPGPLAGERPRSELVFFFLSLSPTHPCSTVRDETSIRPGGETCVVARPFNFQMTGGIGQRQASGLVFSSGARRQGTVAEGGQGARLSPGEASAPAPSNDALAAKCWGEAGLKTFSLLVGGHILGNACSGPAGRTALPGRGVSAPPSKDAMAARRWGEVRLKTWSFSRRSHLRVG